MQKPKSFYEQHGRFKGQNPMPETDRKALDYNLKEVQGCLDELKAHPTKSLFDRLNGAVANLGSVIKRTKGTGNA